MKNDENEVGFRSNRNLRIDLIGSNLLTFGLSYLVRGVISRVFTSINVIALVHVLIRGLLHLLTLMFCLRGFLHF